MQWCMHSSLLLFQALADCVQDLLSPFHDDTIDLVAGIDAMGFILGEKTNQFIFSTNGRCRPITLGDSLTNVIFRGSSYQSAGQET